MADKDGNKTGGRQKGTPNRPNELKTYLVNLVGENQDKLLGEIKKLKGKAYVDAMFALMEYVQPKLSRTEVKAEIKTDLIDLEGFDQKQLKDGSGFQE